MARKPTSGTVRRALLVTILAVIVALAVAKDLLDIVGKPMTTDVQVWFGYRFLVRLR